MAATSCACRDGATCGRYSPAWRWSCCSSSFRRTSARHWCCPACSSDCSASRADGPGWSRLGLAVLLAGFAAAYWTGVPLTVRNRVTMWADPWNNGVPGGTHVAHGLVGALDRRRLGQRRRPRQPEHDPRRPHRFRPRAPSARSSAGSGSRSVVGLYAFLCWRCLRDSAALTGSSVLWRNSSLFSTAT